MLPISKSLAPCLGLWAGSQKMQQKLFASTGLVGVYFSLGKIDGQADIITNTSTVMNMFCQLRKTKLIRLNIILETCFLTKSLDIDVIFRCRYMISSF